MWYLSIWLKSFNDFNYDKSLKEGKMVSDLIKKFRIYLAFDVMMTFMDVVNVQTLLLSNG